jgi:hypothetical protein
VADRQAAPTARPRKGKEKNENAAGQRARRLPKCFDGHVAVIGDIDWVGPRTQVLIESLKHGPCIATGRPAFCVAFAGVDLSQRGSFPPAHDLLHLLHRARLVLGGECGPLLISRRRVITSDSNPAIP